MRREIPVLLAITIGWVMVMDYFMPRLTPLTTVLRGWTLILIAVAQILGMANVARINLDKISRRHPDTPYALALLAGLAAMAILGVVPLPGSLFGYRLSGIQDGTLFDKFYTSLFVPMSATMFSLLAFFIASAAYRAFKVRSPEATILAVTAVVVMLGQVPLPVASLNWEGMPALSGWVMNVPNLAAKRAILIGAALGAIATGMKVILGLERNYIGE